MLKNIFAGQPHQRSGTARVPKPEAIASGAVAEPLEATLRAYYDANLSQFTSAPGVTFEHVYFDPDIAGEAAAWKRAAACLATLTARKHARPAEGDPFPLQSNYAQLDRAGAVQVFGRTAIVDALFAQPPDEWSGPVQPGYGWHLIRITNRSGRAAQPFAAAHDRVRKMYLQAQADAAKRDRYERLRARYVLVREPGTPPQGAR